MKATIYLPIVGVLISGLLAACGEQHAGPIKVVEATYGWNCRNYKVPAPFPNAVKIGNATAPVAAACNGKTGECVYAVDAKKIGDPANTCGKDFSVKYRCGESGDVHIAKLEGEASGKSITLSCPGK